MKQIFLLLFSFLPLFLAAQEKGVGLNFYIEPTFKLLKTDAKIGYDVKTKGVAFSPIFYRYYKNDECHRMNEFSLHIKNLYSGFHKDFYTTPNYGRQLKFRKKLYLNPSDIYDVNVTHINFALNYLYFFPIKKFDELEFWLGFRTSLIFDYQDVRPTTPTALPTIHAYILNQSGLVPTATYKLSAKISLDVRWIPRFWLDSGLYFKREKNPSVPIPFQKELDPIFELRFCTFQPNFEIGAKYALSNQKNKSSKK